MFFGSFSTVSYILKNKINTITFVNTCAARDYFIYRKFAEIVCQILDIKVQRLSKSMCIRRFDARVHLLSIYVINLIFRVRNYIKIFAFLLLLNEIIIL